MKLQDIIWAAVFMILISVRRPEVFVWAGLACIILAIPLFYSWIFFTAARLTWYAAGFFLWYCIISLRTSHTVQ